jgi:GGDEF domain-containing protein
MGTEERRDFDFRKKVDDMSLAEAQYALMTDFMTGLGNNRAYEESTKKIFQVSIDIDDLKWVNDNLNHAAGDALIELVGKSFQKNPNVYHISGDEFILQADTPGEAKAILDAAYAYLEQNKLIFEAPGVLIELQGQFSFGIGRSLDESETEMQAHKQERVLTGQRSGRGQEPNTVNKITDQIERLETQLRYAGRERSKMGKERDEFRAKETKIKKEYDSQPFFIKLFKKQNVSGLIFCATRIRHSKRRIEILDSKIENLKYQIETQKDNQEEQVAIHNFTIESAVDTSPDQFSEKNEDSTIRMRA